MTGSTREVAELRSVMALIDDRLEDTIAALPSGTRALVPNAFLNLAVEWMLAQEGTAVTVAILSRLAELISSGRRPHGETAISLTRADA